MGVPRTNSSRSYKKSQIILPLATETVSAGFPSPADDYIDNGIDLNEQLIKHPASTFFLRVSGHSMTNVGIYDGDLLIVDRSINAEPGKIVIAILDECFVLKKLILNKGSLYLEAAHPDYPTIDIKQYETVQIWGVVIYCIHDLKNVTSSL